MSHEDWIDGEPVESTALAPAPRDESGRIIRVDWSGGPPPPAPDASHVPADATLTPQEGAQIVAENEAEHGVQASSSFDALHPNAQALFRNQEGLDQALASIDKIKDARSPSEFAEMDTDFEGLPVDAQQVVAVLLSHDWTQRGAEALAEALDALSDSLPLTSDAELREFLQDHGFIEPGHR